jgi:hypothetical protein
MDVHSGFLTEFGLVFGPKGQRRWQDDRKVRSVAETLEVGAHMRDVAACYGQRANHLSRMGRWFCLRRRAMLSLYRAAVCTHGC